VNLSYTLILETTMYTQVHPQQMYELAMQRHHALVAACELARTQRVVNEPAAHRATDWRAKVSQFANHIGLARKSHIQTAA
jgi:hypothetical protein